MSKLMRVILAVTCLTWLLSPLSNTVHAVSAAILLTVSNASPAQGEVVQVSGTGFTLTDAGGNLYWDFVSTVVSPVIAASPLGSDGSVLFNVAIPPDAAPGMHIFTVRAPARTQIGYEEAQVNVNVVASQHKAALITGANPSVDASFQSLLNANGITTTLVSLASIASNTSFSAYDLVLIGPDTAPVGTTVWGTQNAVAALSMYGRPILGIGDGGYFYFGMRSLYFGYGNGAHTTVTQVMPVASTSEPFKTPYIIPITQTLALFGPNSPSPAVEFNQPQNDGSTFNFASDLVTPTYYFIMQSGRFLEWGFDGSPADMTLVGKNLFTNLAWYLTYVNNRDTLIVSNLSRMQGLGYLAADVSDLNLHITNLVGQPRYRTNMNAVWVDLGTDAPAAVGTDYAAWDVNKGSVPLTNTLVSSIDAYLENLKHSAYPNLKYFILVGSHEIIPMQARAADNYNETSWGIPTGFLATLYHSTYNGANGYYLTDSVYSDLSYISDGWGADGRLVPEMSVGRLVETPVQISSLIDTYLAANATLSRANLVAIGSQDYMDGATFAADAMGPTADTTLIQNGFLSSLVPTELNAAHSVVYIGGHGDYNWMTTREWDQGFMAGSTGSQGDTEDLTTIPNAVIAAAGCHNGVVFPDLTYHNYSGTTAYGDFPERLAVHDVGVYVAATGFTWVTISGSSTNPADSAYSEKATGLFIKHLLNDGGTTAGKAFQAGVKQYENDRGVGMLDGGDRRALSIMTFYGIPNYHFSQIYLPIPIRFGFSLQNFLPLLTPQPGISPKAVQTTQGVTLDINQYTVQPDGLVTIPGADYSGDSDHPILPVVPDTISFPGGLTGLNVVWNQAASISTTISNDVPAVQAGTDPSIGTIFQQPINETFSGFYPSNLIYSTTTSPLGGGGTDLNLGIIPVQYNKDTHQTTIWTHLAFTVTYTADTTLSSVDSDGDGLPDWWETAHGLDPNDGTGLNGAAGDPDSDGLTNLQEYQSGTDPMNPDSDHDGVNDGVELRYGTNPLNPGSFPNLMFLPNINK